MTATSTPPNAPATYTLEPLGLKVVIRAKEAPEFSEGGIALPQTSQRKQQEGVIVAVGKGKRLDNGTLHLPTVKVGDTVLYSKYGGTEVEINGQELLMMEEDQIFAILRRTEA